MTLYAPSTDSQAYRLIARRLFLGRPAIMVVCATAFVASILTSGSSPYGSADGSKDRIGMSAAIAAPYRTLPRDIATGTVSSLSLPAELVQETDAEVPPSFGDADAMIRAAIKATHPRFEAHPLPDTALVADSFQEVSPEQPDATIRMASLVPPSAGGAFPGDRLFPRMPDTESLTIIPPALSTKDQRDSLGRIDTKSGHTDTGTGADTERAYRVESVLAVGGETLAHLLEEFSINEDDQRATLVALRADSIAETLSADDRVDLAFTPNRKLGSNKLIGIRLHFDAAQEKDDRVVELRWDGEMHDLWAGLTLPEAGEPEIAFRPVTTSEALDGFSFGIGEPERVFIRGDVKTSLYAAADDAGMTPGEATTLTDIFRYLVDFERDLQAGDRFEVLFDKKANGDYGDIVYAMIENRGRQVALFRGQTGADSFEYFDQDGKTNKRSLMRTPLAYARVSSNYGMRRHPIDGYRKMHKGVDFRASTGTPIVAAGNGVVDYLGRRGGYGKYIRIRHNGTYKTAYAHLSRYAQGLSSGMRVKQGDVIGYVGSTGRSTGPHLHFEVIENGKRVNPMEVGDFGPIRSLSGADLARFKAGTARINFVLGELRPKALVAKVE